MGEAQAVQQPFRARARRVGIGIGERRVQLADHCAVVGGFRGGELRLQLSQRGVAVDRVFERRAFQRGRLLGDAGDAPSRGNADLALVGVKLALQQREQARFARAVRADEADLVAGAERDIGAFEQQLGAAAERDLGETDHVVPLCKARIVRGTRSVSSVKKL